MASTDQLARRSRAGERRFVAVALREQARLHERVLEGGQRWLIIHDFPLPSGYTYEKVTFALLVPPMYPAAEIDMFYVHPEPLLSSGRTIPNTHIRATIRGQSFIGWSRHRRGAAVWNPHRDNIVTQIALAEGAIRNEIGE